MIRVGRGANYPDYDSYLSKNDKRCGGHHTFPRYSKPPDPVTRPDPVEVLMSAKHGRCQCGAVQFSVYGPLRDVVYCHCKMCRRSIGHVLAATACAVPHLHIQGEQSLQWYQSSASARRGFCKSCGSNLFWIPASGTHVSILAGTLDDPSGLTAAAHIHVDTKGDYYSIDDGLPQHRDGEHGVRIPAALAE
jgi:hypothetical protein